MQTEAREGISLVSDDDDDDDDTGNRLADSDDDEANTALQPPRGPGRKMGDERNPPIVSHGTNKTPNVNWSG